MTTTTKYIAIGSGHWGTGLTFGEAHKEWRKAGGRTRNQPPKMAVFSTPTIGVYVDQWGNVQWDGNAELSPVHETPETWVPFERTGRTSDALIEMMEEWGLARTDGDAQHIHHALTPHDIIVLVGEFLEDW